MFHALLQDKTIRKSASELAHPASDCDGLPTRDSQDTRVEVSHWLDLVAVQSGLISKKPAEPGEHDRACTNVNAPIDSAHVRVGARPYVDKVVASG